jgi:hypothetical protein
MTTNDKKEFVRKVGLYVASTTQVHAAVQKEPVPVATTTEVTAPAGAPVPGNQHGSIFRTMLSANAPHREQTPASTTTSVTLKVRSRLIQRPRSSTLSIPTLLLQVSAL